MKLRIAPEVLALFPAASPARAERQRMRETAIP
jgi:hypothetical protein